MVTGFGLYLTVLAIASLGSMGGRVSSAVAGQPSSRLLVVIPAHNEEALIGRTVDSLLKQDYPRELVRVIVIADNCTDSTASKAGRAGAEVMVRTDTEHRGKGWALRWAMDTLFESDAAFDAVVVVDADSVAAPHFLAALEHELAAGHDVVQADYTLAAVPGNPRSELVAAAFLLFHRVRFGGRRRLGLPVSLVGNGMLFSRTSLTKHPWNAFTGAEDLERSVELRLAGLRPRFAPDAHIEGAPAASRSGLMRQRMRWEGGRFHVIRTRLPKLVRQSFVQRDAGLLDAALDLATLPLGLLGLVAGTGTVIVAIAIAGRVALMWAALPWLAADASIAAFVLIGLVGAGAPASTWRALAFAPAFLAWKLAAYGRLVRHFDSTRWERSDRPGERVAAEPGRVEIAGVPVDRVDLRSALRRAEEALNGNRLFHVTTVNLDFIVRAQTDRTLRTILGKSDLSVADGAPVVWLARVLGARMPGRVAGADLVPAIIEAAAESGRRVFLLGGENGVAQAAAARLQSIHPGLDVCGTYEPARARAEDMDHESILARIDEARPDLLLVALGNPKQERWIDLHRDRLPVRVAIGVGCVFDLIAGTRKRAPRWMQVIGLEWVYRLVQEPARLAGRYATDLVWLPILALQTLRARFTRPAVSQAI